MVGAGLGLLGDAAVDAGVARTSIRPMVTWIVGAGGGSGWAVSRPAAAASAIAGLAAAIVTCGCAMTRAGAADFWERLRFPELLRLTRTPQGWRST